MHPNVGDNIHTLKAVIVVTVLAVLVAAVPAQAGFITHQVKAMGEDVGAAVDTHVQNGHPEPTFADPTAGVEATGGGGIPAELETIAQCESGGDYSALNPSGAGGKYQIMPETWAAHGGSGNPQDAAPAEQDRIALLIWDGGAGRSQWVC